MTRIAVALRSAGRRGPLTCGLLMALALFAADTVRLGPPAFCGLYVVAVLVSSMSGKRGSVAVVASASALLIVLSFVLAARSGTIAGETSPDLLSLAALGVATLIVMRGLGAASLAASHARLLDETHDGLNVRTIDGTITYWNRASSTMYGWSGEEALGRKITDILATRWPQSEESVMAAVREIGTWEGEVINQTRDGRDILVESRLALICDGDGRPSAILETAKDITHRRRADEERRLSEARYHGMFQTMGVAYWEMDFSLVRARCAELWNEGIRDFPAYLRDHPRFVREMIALSRPRDVNAASVRLFGADSAQHLMTNFGACWPPEGEPVFAGAMLAALRNTPTFESEAILRGVDGRRLEVLFTVSYPPGSESRENIVVALVDLAESNRAKAELRSAQDDLAHAMRLNSLGILTATIAHEVNQPLGGVIANGRAALRWLRRETPALDEVAGSIESALSEAKRAADVLARIRAMARKAEPEPVSLDLNELVEETMTLLAGELRNANVQLSLVLERPSPSVVADRIQLQQVVINLALNSVHALEEVANRPRVLTICTSSSGDAAMVSVDDTGPGILPDQAEKLFTPFFTTKAQGLGVGLSLCGNIIERHGGKIAVVAKPTPGFHLQFTLPLSA